jgi:hypothetical protein
VNSKSSWRSQQTSRPDIIVCFLDWPLVCDQGA